MSEEAKKPQEKKPAPAKAEGAKSAAPKEKKPKAAGAKAGAKDAPKAEPIIAPESLTLDGLDDASKVKIPKIKGAKQIHNGVAHILATFNNTVVSITDQKGNVIAWSSAGKMGFRGSKKSTAYVAQVVAQDACRQAMAHGVKEVEVRLKGPGTGRESAVRALQAVGLEVSTIRDVTPVPFNGCRMRKARRV
ncbi:30S ribosomal protein S11 [bacterium]|nr:30S ribosomal protein S11 [bacterium]